MAEENIRRTAQEILDIPVRQPSLIKRMMVESDWYLGQLEQLNLDETPSAPSRLKELMFDFFRRVGFVPTINNGDVASVTGRLPINRALDWIYSCQEIILGQEDEDESTLIQSSAEDGSGVS